MELVDGYFFMPIVVFSSSISSLIAPNIDAKLGVKVCLFISTVLTVVANYLIAEFTELRYIYFGMGLIGTAMGISLSPVLKNAWLYFPGKSGLISGLILFGFGVSAFFFSSLADFIINPNFAKANSQGYFEKEVSDNVKRYLKIYSIIADTLAISSFFLIISYKKKEIQKENEVKVPLNKAQDKDDDIEVKHPIIQAFSHIQVWQIVIMVFSTSIFTFICGNTYRTFGQINQMDELLLSYLSKIFALINGVGRLMWGILFDKFSFKSLYGTLVVAEIFVSSILYFVISNQYVYFGLICVSGFILAGNVALVVPLYPKIFGLKYTTMVFSIGGFLAGLHSMVVPIISKKILHSKEDYKYLFWVGTGFSILSFIILLTFSEKKFQYKPDDEESEKGTELETKEV